MVEPEVAALEVELAGLLDVVAVEPEVTALEVELVVEDVLETSGTISSSSSLSPRFSK